MSENSSNIQCESRILRRFFPEYEDVNIGIIFVGIYFIFEFGSLQGLFPIINEIRLPFIVSLLSVGYAVYLVLTARVDFSSKTTRAFTLLCIFVIIYSILSSEDKLVRDDMVKIFVIYLANYLIIVSSVKKPSQFILLLDIWMASIALSSYHGIMQGGLIWGNRWLKDENHISLVVALAFPYAFVCYTLYGSKLKKLFYFLCLSLYVTVNVVAHSRGGFLSMLLAVLFCWLLTEKKVRNSIIIIIATIMVLCFSPAAFFEEISTLKQGTEEGTASDRIYLWGIALEMFYDHPVLGVGPMNYQEYFSDYEKGVKYPLGSRRPPHTTPLQWLAEMGLTGTIILVALLMALYRNWRLAFAHKKIITSSGIEQGSNLFPYVSHACMISQVVFWFGSIFLSLMPYPFYWCLPAFSEAWKSSKLSLSETENVDIE